MRANFVDGGLVPSTNSPTLICSVGRGSNPTIAIPTGLNIELVCSYPDDDQLADALKGNWLTADQFQIMIEFRQVLLSYSAPGGNDFDNASVLNDPSWLAVIKAAGQAKLQLLLTTIDERERRTLMGNP